MAALRPLASLLGRSGQTDHVVERAGGVKGKWLIIITAALIVTVPLVTVLGLRLIERDLRAADKPLMWAERAAWKPVPIAADTMERGPMSASRTGKAYIDSPLQWTAEQELALRRCAALAAGEAEAFDAVETAERLRAIAEERPELFYPRYLLAVWSRRAGDAAGAERWMSEAVDRAGYMLIQPVRRADGSPAAGVEIGRIELGLDRVVADHVDDSLVLVYPLLVTDERGWVYLPVPQTIYRWHDAEPGEVIRTPLPASPHWFTFPGRVGKLAEWSAEAR